MANNDRLANGGNLGDSPGWKADEKESVMRKTPLLTANMVGIGWNTSRESRLIVTKNAEGVPGWRARVFVPENLALVTVDTSNVVITDESDYIIPSGSYVEKGTTLKVHHNLGTSKPYGCKVNIQRQETTDLNYWVTNYTDNVNNGHTPKSFVIQQDIRVLAEARERVTAAFASGVEGVIIMTCNCSSWGPRGYQTAGLTLTNEFQSLESMEVFKGDYLKTNYSVNSAYDWAEFQVGASPSKMYDEDPEFGDHGGYHEFTMENSVTYIGMTALKSTNFYIYQPASSDFSQCRAEVTNVSFYRIHKSGVELPYDGQRIDFGRNGAVGNHPRLYPGTRIRVFAESTNTYVAAGYQASDSKTRPSPSIPSKAEYYPDGVTLNVTGTPVLAIGLYWIKTGVNLTSKTVQGTYIKDSYDTFADAPSDRLNNALQLKETSAWTKPSGAVAAWLQNINWSFSQTSERSAGVGPSTAIEFPYSTAGDLSDRFTGSVENAVFTFNWQMGVGSITEGQNFSLTAAGQCMNYYIGTAPGQMRDPWAKIVTSWTFRAMVITCTGAA